MLDKDGLMTEENTTNEDVEHSLPADVRIGVRLYWLAEDGQLHALQGIFRYRS